MECKDIPERFTIRTVSPHLPDDKPVSPYCDDFTCTEIKPTSANLLEETNCFSSIASSYIEITSGNSKYRVGDGKTMEYILKLHATKSMSYRRSVSASFLKDLLSTKTAPTNWRVIIIVTKKMIKLLSLLLQEL
ncbi:hypothetical protein Gotur_027884 [Gossypium turneri]